jgi:exodeoxyribonuclease-1
MALSFYWHDYETWGADPSRDRPAQFAGLRTDADLNPVAEPLVVYCRPADDMLPQPDACLVTGITPQYAYDHGLPEADFMDRIHREMSRPGTCSVGYNSIRFDDEVTRYGLYRNFFDPYAREWRGGNSRWDLIDVARLAHALRPEGVRWPKKEDGVTTSFRLEELSAANGIGHESAHDALSDVRATIALARLLKQAQPKLYQYALTLRDKKRAAAVLDLEQPQPLLHVSSRYPAELGCIAPVLPLARHPVNRNAVLVFDLRSDPSLLLDLDAERIRQRVFTPAAELPEGVERIPLKGVHVNRSPMLAPMNTLSPEAAERWRIEPGRVQEHARLLADIPGLAAKIAEVFHAPQQTARTDPDQDLYGAFLGDDDRVLAEQVRRAAPEELGAVSFPFLDKRLPTLLFRYRARNWPQTLAPEERRLWDIYRRKRLREPAGGSSITLDAYRERLRDLRSERAGDAESQRLLAELEAWPEAIGMAR